MKRVIAISGQVVQSGAVLALFVALSPAAQPATSSTKPAPPVAGLPSIEALFKNYPKVGDAELKKIIGGAVTAAWITNTAAIRMSRAFNDSGSPIPAGPPNSVAGMHTVMGGDKKHYAYRNAEFASWLRAKHGQPTLSFKSGPYGQAPAALVGKPGIIQFQDCGWADASGHIDLWDGQKAAGKAHFETCKQLHVWQAKPVGAAARTAVVIATTNVRAGPSTASAIVGPLAKGAVVTLAGSAPNNNFWQIGPNQYVNAAQLKLQ